MVYNRIMRGQIALIVLLISAVMMTVGLSVSKRAVVETRVDSDEESLKQAFNAAESGIENYLKTGALEYISKDGRSNATVIGETIGGGASLNYDEFTVSNSSVYYWLRDHKADGTINYGSGFDGSDLRVCVEDGFTGTLKVDFFYRTPGNTYLVWRNGYNFGASPNRVNGYVDSGYQACTGRTGAKEVVLTGVPIVGNTPLLIVVKPIFSGTRISVRTATVGATFSVQGQKVSSTGKVGAVGSGSSGESGSGSSQVIKVNTGYFLPAFMIEAVNAEGSVLSN